MWLYRQESGQLERDGEVVATGYSGFGIGKNNSTVEALHNVGPIPRGKYKFGAAHDTETHGPEVLPLFPYLGTDMHGRSGFLIHGDSKQDPGKASHGCIILPRAVRELLSQSEDRDLQVV